MMRTILAIIFTAILSFILGEYLPWWSIAVAAFAISVFVNQSPFAAFLGGFLGIGLFWVGYAAWIDNANNSLLSERIAVLLPLQGEPLLLITFTGMIGGLIGGMAGLSANFLVRRSRTLYDSQNYYRNKMR